MNKSDSRFLDAVVCDIDSSLADTRHRHHLSPHRNKESTWEEYSMACDKDTVIRGTALVLKAFLDLGHSVHLVSRRKDVAYDKTRQWLKNNAVAYNTLKLHSSGDLEDGGEFKVDYIGYLRRIGFNPILVIEDWPAEAHYIESNTGLPVLVVNPCYEGTSL